MRFFISSTYEDLKEYRKYTIEYLINLTDKKTGNFAAMEYFAASENTSKEVCLTELEKSDIVIGIYGSRFGWEEKETGRSMTEIEFDRAIELGKPILGFVTYQEQERRQKIFIHDKVFAQGKNCARFSSLQDYADVLHDSIKTYFVDTEGYAYCSIWDDIKLMRQIIDEDINAGSLHMKIYEDGADGYAAEEILNCVNNIYSFLPCLTDLYYANSPFFAHDKRKRSNGRPTPGAYGEIIFMGLPNNLNKIRLAASFLKLTILQKRLLTEIWTENLRQEVLKARDEYIEISQNSYHID